MKIGLSLSRCVLDIVEGRVDIDNVLVIIARTDFDPHDDAQWSSIWAGYGGNDHRDAGLGINMIGVPEWTGQTDQDKFRSVCIELWESGRLHQPRKFGAYPARRREFWLETVLPDSELEHNPAARDAWDQFQVIAGLTNIKLDREYQ